MFINTNASLDLGTNSIGWALIDKSKNAILVRNFGSCQISNLESGDYKLFSFGRVATK